MPNTTPGTSSGESSSSFSASMPGSRERVSARDAAVPTAVEITAAKEGGPSRDWLNAELGYLVSHRAKSKVRAWFNAQAMEETMARGREAIEKLLQREGKTAIKLDDLAVAMGVASSAELFEQVGKDELSLRSIELHLRPAEPEPPVEQQPDIKLEQEKQRRALEKKRAEEERQRQLEEQRKLEAQRKADEQRKLEAQKKREQELAAKKREEERQAAEAKRKEEERQRKEEAKRRAEAEAKAAKERERVRKDQLARMQELAGTGSPNATGRAAHSAGPSANWAGKVRAAVKPNIVFTDVLSGNPRAEVEVKLAPDGTIVGKKLVRSSGVQAWDDAVLRALDKTRTLPRDTDGTMPSGAVLVFRPKD